jgi:hypothetical protein
VLYTIVRTVGNLEEKRLILSASEAKALLRFPDNIDLLAGRALANTRVGDWWVRGNGGMMIGKVLGE